MEQEPWMKGDSLGPVELCFICDAGYVDVTVVALRSLLASKEPQSRYRIHVVTVDVAPCTCNCFEKLCRPGVEVRVIPAGVGELGRLHQADDSSICVATHAALLKFRLPGLLPNLEKVLYLDGDLIVRSDLTSLFCIDLHDKLAGVVPDSGQIYFKHDFVRRVKRYFNSGVMLLNLAQMRLEGLEQRLIDIKQSSADGLLMDQNVFNLAFDGRVTYLPIRYNFMPVSLVRARGKWTLPQINALFGTDYASERDLFADAAIIHYSSRDKPWKAPDGAMACEWRRFGEKRTFVSARPTVSVVMPMYNVSAYVSAALESLCSQTFSDFEVICLDDGSTDETVARVVDCQKRMSLDIRLIRHANLRQGYERNRGVEIAKGRYVYFMDADDVLMPNALERIVSLAEAGGLDLLFFEGESFYEEDSLRKLNPRFDVAYRRDGAYPLVYRGRDLYGELRARGDLIISPCLQLVRRDLLIFAGITFPEDMVMMEDNLYVVRILLFSQRATVIPDVLYRRRVRTGSTMTGQARSQAEVDSCIRLYDELVALAERQGNDNRVRGWLLHHALAFASSARHLGGNIPPRVRYAIPRVRRQMKICLAGARRRTFAEFARGVRRCLLDNGWKYTFFHAIGRMIGRA